MGFSFTVYGVTFTIRVLLALLSPLIWRSWWHRKGKEKFIKKYIKWVGTHGHEDHSSTINSSAKLYAKLFYIGSWLLVWLLVLLLLGIMKGWGDPNSKIIYISSSFIGVLGVMGGVGIIKETFSGVRLIMNKYGGLGDQMGLHHHYDKGVHHHAWQGEVDIFSTKYLTDRYTTLTIENHKLRDYAHENIDGDEFYHAHLKFPVNQVTRKFACGQIGRDAIPAVPPDPNVPDDKGTPAIPKKEDIKGIAQLIEEDERYGSTKVLLADADESDRKRIADIRGELSSDEWDDIRLPTVKFEDFNTALLRLPVRSWEDERDVKHEVIKSGILDRFY